VTRSIASPLLGAVAALVALAAAPSAWATTYYVAQSTGADTNDGSQAHPFATVSACAAAVKPGDTCTVHAGTYRETVTVKTSGTAAAPITFSVADGECATVSGADVFTAPFTQGQGNVWTAPVSGDIPEMFSKGTIVWEAQWPNRTPGAILDLPKGVTGQGTGVQTVDGGAVTLLVDPNIPPGDWTGATVFILPGERWQSDSRPIKAYDPATHTLTLDTTVPWAEKATQPVPSNPYYLYGSILALDTQDEWVVQNGLLYYYSTDDPANHGLEQKTRSFAFDLQASYVSIVGFHVFSAAVKIAGNHDTVDSLAIEYPSHFRSFNAYYTTGDGNLIQGDDNVWKNSIIEKSGSAGVLVAGNRNLIQNNIANDVTYQATNEAAFAMDNWQATYQGNVFSNNTVNRSGRSGITQYGAAGGRVVLNKITSWAQLTFDMGGIYAWGTDGHGTEIAWNELAEAPYFMSNGIYLDDATKHFVVHHNYVHDSLFYGMCLKEENQYFNNTFEHVGTPVLISANVQNNMWQGTNLAQVENNVTDGTLLVRVGILPTVVTDYGYYEADVHPTATWQHVVLPFSQFYQPGWFIPAPFDLTSIQQIAFTPQTNGDFEIDVANIQLESSTPLLVDDFASPGAANGLGGYPWGGGSGDADGGTGTTATLTYGSGGPGTSSKYAVFSGTMVMGDNSWGVFTESVPNQSFAAYTAISLDIRAEVKGFKVLGTGGSPIQSHNAVCAVSGTTVPACAAGQGAVIPGVTEGNAGKAPDLGAFASSGSPWTAGAARPDDATLCGKIPDIQVTLPPRAPNPWADGGVTDAGAEDAGPDLDAGTGGGPTSNTKPSSGCGCRVADAGASGSWAVVGAGLTGMALRRVVRRRRRERAGRT
jgi:MYXO-CTERM domain-containing protein